jgi:selenide,water dikinase
MGGKPIFANAILGWPVGKLSPGLAAKVIEGASAICAEARIPLAGGHSIDSPEPVFGLSVNGLAEIKNIRKNAGAKEGDLLYLTKKIGVGILSTALKRGVILPQHKEILLKQLVALNLVGEKAGTLQYVSAMTDITGFGLLGHLIEMAEGSSCSAQIDYNSVPLIEGLQEYTSKMIVPDNLYRNWNSYEKKVKNIGAESFFTLSDPQTNGGLLIAVDPAHQKDFENFLRQNDLGEFAKPLGKITAKGPHAVEISA